MAHRKHSSKRWLLAAIIPASMFIALTCWGLSSPMGSSPDEDYHLTSIWCAQGTREGLCGPGDSAITRTVPKELVTASGCYNFRPNKSGECPEYPSSVMVTTSRGNFDGSSYPPLYYLALSVFASKNITASIMAMRVFNAALFVGLTTALFFLVRRSWRGPLIWGGVAALVPLGMFLIPSVNPSGWAIVSAVLLWVSLVAFFSEKSGRRRMALGALALVATVMGAGARSDSAVYCGIASLAAVIIGFERTRRFAMLCLFPIALVVVDLVFFFSSGQSEAINPATSDASLSRLLSLFETNFPLLPNLWSGALGTWGLGWLDTKMPGMVWVTTIGVFLAFVFWGLQRGGWRKSTAQWIVFGSLVVIPLYILLHDQVIIGQYVQPRYIYPLLIMLLGISLIGFHRDDLGLNRVQLAFVVAALSIANAVALHTNLRRYVTGTSVGGFNLDKNEQWWWHLPFGPLMVWAVGTVFFSVALIGLAVYSKSASRLPPPMRIEAGSEMLTE